MVKSPSSAGFCGVRRAVVLSSQERKVPGEADYLCKNNSWQRSFNKRRIFVSYSNFQLHCKFLRKKVLLQKRKRACQLTSNPRHLALISDIFALQPWLDHAPDTRGKSFDFKRATVFSFGHRPTKHKLARFSRNFGTVIALLSPWLRLCLLNVTVGSLTILRLFKRYLREANIERSLLRDIAWSPQKIGVKYLYMTTKDSQVQFP